MILEFGDGYRYKGLLDSLIAEGGVKSRDLSWEVWLLKLIKFV